MIHYLFDKHCNNLLLRALSVVSDALWKPDYDLHASSVENSESVRLDYRAKVTQSTGEDWADAEVTLSSASASGNVVPKLPTYKISSPTGNLFFNPPQPASNFQQALARDSFGNSSIGHSSASGAFGQPASGGALFGATAASGGGGLFGSQQNQQPSPAQPAAVPQSYSEENAGAVPLSESTAVIRTNSVSELYVVQGRVKIPSDGEDHTVSIASFDVEGAIARVCVPRLNADVYLQCKVKNTSNYRLFAGDVRVFLDDSYVSSLSLLVSQGLFLLLIFASFYSQDDVEINDGFEVALGVDTSVKVSYLRRPRTTIDPPNLFGETEMSSTTYTTLTTVQNNHSNETIALTLKDALPIGDDSKSWRVVLRKPKGLADAVDEEEVTIRDGAQAKQKIRWSKLPNGKGGQTEGKYEWVVEIPAGVETTLVSEWDVKVPNNTRWVEQPQVVFGRSS